MIFAEDSAGPFQDDKLDEGIGVILQHHGGAGNRGGDGRGVDLGATGILRHAQEHGAAAEFEVAGALAKTEDRVGAKAGEGLIGKGELGARFNSGAHGGAFAHFVPDHGGPRRGLRRQQFDVLDHLADPCFFELRSGRASYHHGQKKRNDRGRKTGLVFA